MKYDVIFKSSLKAIEEKLEKVLPPGDQYPPVLHRAMRYSVFPSGKRFRPVLALAVCEAAGGKASEALLPAVAIELIHSYSLVHDDLPAMDNDDIRRGRPTCHKQFGEAIALLAGDGLLTLAFHCLAQVRPAERVAALLEEISTAAGSYGMIGGQVADMIAGHEPSVPLVEYINIHKKGKLIKASSVAGAISAGASKDAMIHFSRYGELLGLAFQSVDDLLDGDGYLKVVKPSEIRQKVRDLIAQAKREIKKFGAKAEKLHTLADFLLRRIPRITHVALDQ